MSRHRVVPVVMWFQATLHGGLRAMPSPRAALLDDVGVRAKLVDTDFKEISDRTSLQYHGGRASHEESARLRLQSGR